MPKQISAKDYEAILKLMRAYPNGASIDEIDQACDFLQSRRTLLRRLNHLVEMGQLERSGLSAAIRYKLSGAESGFPASDQSSREEIYIKISQEGHEIKKYVRQAISYRDPVGYNRDFLDAYEPNQTRYLPEDIRDHLRKVSGSHDAATLAGTFARTLLNNLLIDLSWNSSRFEGNTYSLIETEHLIATGEAAKGKDAFETTMIINHKNAIEFLVEAAADIGFNSYTILNLHALLADTLLANPKSVGSLRTIPVGIGKTVYHPPEVPQLIEECFQLILQKANNINDPFEQAFFAMVHLPYLQPFEDVNKRVSRLAANIPFIKNNLSPISFVDVPARAYIDGIIGVYELNRVELLRDVFVWAYERSSARYSATRQSLGEPDPFRVRYRKMIAEVVAEAVRSKIEKKNVTQFIRNWAADRVEHKHMLRFVEVTETELLALREGNIARYHLRPSEYKAWRSVW